MEIIDLVKRFSGHSGVTAVNQVWSDERVRTIHFKGLSASAAPMLFAALSTAEKPWKVPVVLFVLNDLEEAGYFYHDLIQMLGESKVLFLPSSYRRAIKYGQKDSANEVLRTEVLTRLVEEGSPSLYVVTYPDALAELVVSQNTLTERSLSLAVGDTLEPIKIETMLVDEGFERVDYVYEPGQFAVRGGIIDVFSYASEYPFRIDFFGDEIDSIRTLRLKRNSRAKRCRTSASCPTSMEQGSWVWCRS